MRLSSISVQKTSWPAAARHAPVTSPTYPHPITVKRTLISPNHSADGVDSVLFPGLNHRWFANPGISPEKQAAKTEQHQSWLAPDHVPQQPRCFVPVNL